MGGLLLVVAHPDDEIFCSGLLCHISSKNVPIHIACLTRGEGGQLGHPPIANRRNIAGVREAEMRRAADVIGVASLTFLDHIDPEPVGSTLQAPDHDPEQLLGRIEKLIVSVDPEVVMTHGSTGDYGHPAHVLVHNMTSRATKGQRRTLYSFNAFFPGSGRLGSLNRRDWASFLFDGSAYSDIRFESFWCHQTQWPVFVGEKDSEEAYRTALQKYFDQTALESYCLQFGGQKDPLQSWLEEYRSEPPSSGPLTRFRYMLLWKLRDLARSVKRAISR